MNSRTLRILLAIAVVIQGIALAVYAVRRF
jgi:hypothetical protein